MKMENKTLKVEIWVFFFFLDLHHAKLNHLNKYAYFISKLPVEAENHCATHFSMILALALYFSQ